MNTTTDVDLEQLRGRKGASNLTNDKLAALGERFDWNQRQAARFLGYSANGGGACGGLGDLWESRLGRKPGGGECEKRGQVYESAPTTPAEAWEEIKGGVEHPARKKKSIPSGELIEIAREVIREQTHGLPELDLRKPHNPTGQGDEEDMVAMFSDLQTGHRTATTNAGILRERTRRYAQKVLAIAKLHRRMYPIRRLRVFGLGDMVQNELIGRFVSLGELEDVVGRQYLDASDAFAEFLLLLAPHFDEITVDLVRGNHGQVQEYAANQSSWDDVVYERTRLLLQNQANVSFTIADRFFMFVDVRGYRFLLVHGDQINTAMGIPLYGIAARGMRWQGSLGSFDYMAIGHFHTPAMMTWNNTEILMNGCFVTDDEFVAKKYGFSSQAKQVVFGVHDQHGITWRYNLDLKEEAAA